MSNSVKNAIFFHWIWEGGGQQDSFNMMTSRFLAGLRLGEFLNPFFQKKKSSLLNMYGHDSQCGKHNPFLH